MKNMKKMFVALLISGCTCSPVAFAAQQGNLGRTSTGSITIDMEVEPLVKISGLEDLTIPANSTPGSTILGLTHFCVFSNTENSGYNIRVNGSGENGIFQLTDGAESDASTINYELHFAGSNIDTTGTGDKQLLSPGIQKHNYTGGNSVDHINCRGDSAKNATLMLRIGSNLTPQLKAGTYTGTVTLTVAPE